MTQAIKAFERRVLISGAALLFTGLLFIVLPYFMTAKKTPATLAHVLEGFRLVKVAQVSESRSDPLPELPDEEIRPPEKQQTAAPQRLETPTREFEQTAVDVPVETPKFDINPNLTSGPPVALPKSKPAPPAPMAGPPITLTKSSLSVARPTPMAAPAPTIERGAYDQSEVDQVPRATNKEAPRYPYRARKLNITGEVRVKFLVDATGAVRDIRIIRSKPPNVFDESVISALSAWRFAPGIRQGKSVATWVTTTIEFELEGGR